MPACVCLHGTGRLAGRFFGGQAQFDGSVQSASLPKPLGANDDGNWCSTEQTGGGDGMGLGAAYGLYASIWAERSWWACVSAAMLLRHQARDGPEGSDATPRHPDGERHDDGRTESTSKELDLSLSKQRCESTRPPSRPRLAWPP